MSSSTNLPLAILSGRSDAEPLDPDAVAYYVHGVVMQQYFQVATTTVLIYDALITFDREVKYFWKVPGRAVDCVFFLNRYVGILGTIAFICCNFAVWTGNLANWVTIISIDYILMVRVLALYSGAKTLSMVIGLLLVLEAIYKLAFVIYGIIIERVDVGTLAENVTVCGGTEVPPWRLGMLDWLFPMIYGAILMVLALYKAAQYWKMSAGFKGTTLVKILIRDQALYFMLVVACCVLNVIEFRLKMSNEFVSQALAALGSPALLTIIGSRMLFNLKEAAELGVNGGTNVRVITATMSSMDFGVLEIPQRQSVAADAASRTLTDMDFAEPEIPMQTVRSRGVLE